MSRACKSFRPKVANVCECGETRQRHDDVPPWLPSVEDNPPLVEWLKRHNARLSWSAEPVPGNVVQGWRVGTGLVIVVLYGGRQQGWDLASIAPTNDIAETLADAEKRCGVQS